MSSAFTVMWNRHRVKIAKDHGLPDQRIPFLAGGPHVSQPDFVRAGVTSGDVIYPVAIRDGIVRVLAAVVAGRILTVEDFREQHPDFADYQLHCGAKREAVLQQYPWLRAVWWTCTDKIVLAARSSRVRFQTRLPAAMLERLTYASQKRERGVRGIVDGLLTSPVSLHGIYRLAPSSAADFASLVSPED